jgi:OmpA-OmpF porin, OOP family
MKPVCQIIFLLFVGMLTYAQVPRSDQPSILGVNFSLSDYKSEGIGGLGIAFIKSINNHLDWEFGLNGAYPDSLMKEPSSLNEKRLLIEANASLRIRVFDGPQRIQPYLTVGFGLSKYKDQYGVFSPAGLGMQARMFKGVYLLMNAQYRISYARNINSHYFYSIGLASVIGKRKSVPAQKKHVELPVMQQIAVGDRDNDGIIDTADNCPDVPGLAKYMGCPPPDTYKDGVNDEEDNCLDIPGSKNNAGCPVIGSKLKDSIDMAARNIQFETGSAKLKPESYKALDEVIGILKKNTAFKLTIEGHTDNAGTEAANEVLSRDRAKAVLGYMQVNGILSGRLDAKGYGQRMPIADNDSPEGRAVNRRVEFKLRY